MSDTFKRLSNFISDRKRMRMSHIYQPVMLMHLLENEGTGTVTSIAKAILLHDPTQVEYYKHIVRRYPGPVLRDPKKDLVERNGNSYTVKGFEDLSNEDIEALVKLCEERLTQYLDSKKTSPFDHRRLPSAYISGTKIHEVFKNAKYRCQLCGASAEDVALTVDHILPRKFGGTSDISNLQALCHPCNSRKGATDSTDFRGMAESYHFRETGCQLCELPDVDWLSSNELCYSAEAQYPETEGHTVFVPKRHVADYFQLHQPELNAIQRLV